MIFNEVIKKKLFSNTRSSNIYKNTIGSFLLKSFGLFVSFYTVRITIDLLDQKLYGVWLTLFSVVSWIQIMDVGLGNGFRNKFAEAVAKGDNSKAQQLVEVLYSVIAFMAGLGFVVIVLLNNFVEWNLLLNVPSNLVNDLSFIVIMVFGFFLMQFVLKNINVILLSLQKTFMSDLLGFLANMLMVILLQLLVIFDLRGLFYVSFIYMFSPVIVLSFFTVYFFSGALKKYAPKSFLWDKSKIASIMSLGVKFYIIQLTTIFLFSTSSIIITHLFGPSEVTPYNIAYRLFSSMMIVFSVITTPYWSAYTEAFTKGDYIWMKNSVNKLVGVWLIFTFIVVILLLFSDKIYAFWLGSRINIPFVLSSCFALYVIVLSWAAIFSQFLNGIGKVTLQLYLALVQLVLIIPLTIFLSKTIGMGVSGVVIGIIICIFIAATVLPLQVYKILNGNAKGVWLQ